MNIFARAKSKAVTKEDNIIVLTQTDVLFVEAVGFQLYTGIIAQTK